MQPQYPEYPRPVGDQFERPPDTGDGKSVASMVVGICSIVFAALFGIGLILGIIAVALGGRLRRLNGMAMAGFVSGILGIVFSSVWWIIAIAVVTSGD
jgi:hypothetical protein